jgi:hypothetical protein
MSIQSFIGDIHTRDEVFDYIEKHIEAHALQLLKSGQDTQGLKNAFDIINKAKTKMIAEFGQKKVIKNINRAV